MGKIILLHFSFFCLSYSQDGVWPIDGDITLTSAFGPRVLANNIYNFHKGIDLQAGIGTPVYASMSGEVVFVLENTTPEGHGLKIYDSNNAVGNAYYHLDAAPLFVNGDYVNQNELIGHSGNSGNSTGPHLHFNYYRGGYVNANVRHPLNNLEYVNSNDTNDPSPTISNATADDDYDVSEINFTVETKANELDFVAVEIQIWNDKGLVDFDRNGLLKEYNAPQSLTINLDENDSNTEVTITINPNSFDYDTDSHQEIDFTVDLSNYFSTVWGDDISIRVADVSAFEGEDDDNNPIYDWNHEQDGVFSAKLLK